MAVQAQYLSSNFCNRIQNNLMMDDELQMLCGGNNNDAVFSNQGSELTCIGSKKRRMIEESSVMLNQTPPIDGYNSQNSVVDHARLIESAGTSTSGRPVAQDLVVHLYQQGLELDALISVHNERLRLGLEQARKRHCRALISAFEQQVLKKLKEKEIELDLLSRKNADLEEKVCQISVENQIWFSVAKNNEAIVSSLKERLEQFLLQNTVNNNGAVNGTEGYGDSDGMEDDSQSRNNGTVVTAVKDRRWICRVCCDKDVSVLVLPCKHLCLCKDCESKANTCPVCHISKNACLQIFIG